MSIDQIDSQAQEERSGWSFEEPMSHQSHEIIGEEQEEAMAPSLEQIEGNLWNFKLSNSHASGWSL